MISKIPKKPISGDEIRDAFLKFYEGKSHKIVSSASLIPDDPTVMLTIAGMLPFKSIFLGLQERPSPRLTSSQKCIRTNDIENVGVTARHHTFFEMLGNFSFGNYFKREAIIWAWELVTTVYKLDKRNIVISIYYKDDESKKIWEEEIGINPERIIKLDEKDNFWSSGSTGPCGPCSELYYDFYPERGNQVINLEDDQRFIEFYNLVFMQYNRDSSGRLSDLESKNIDTGMGLERIAQILQNKKNNYETDLIYPIIERASELAKVDYFSSAEKVKISLKIIGDHTRAVVHLISDGVIASNLGRGYILRRLIRRMVRHGRLLGIQDKFLADLAMVAVHLMKNTYPDLEKNLEQILSEIEIEEIRFLETLERGEKLLHEIINSREKVITGSKAFELYDTYGFPVELTKEIADENSITVDLKGFEKEMKAQKDRAKAASQSIDLTLKGSIERDIDLYNKTIFTGYESDISQAVIKGIFLNGNSIQFVEEGQKVQLILDKTSFYAESGGQIGDTGLIHSNNAEFLVENVISKKGVFLHCGVVKRGSFKIDQIVETSIHTSNRLKAACNHTATHLLQSALKKVVGENVSQRGSLVAFNKLRFDFNSQKPVTKDQLYEIERLVNLWIMENRTIIVKTMLKDDAIKEGAVAMFGEKYEDQVRVIDIPGVSLELCGGTHIKNTSELGCFKITSELGISSGVRRIEAISGSSVFEYLNLRNSIVNQLSDFLKSNANQIFERVRLLQTELINKNKELQKVKAELAKLKYSALSSNAEQIGSFSALITEINGLDGNALQSAAFELTSKLGENSAVVLGGVPDSSNKVLFVVSFGSNLVNHGFHAGKFINQIARICSGGGGGKPNIAQAGAKDPSKINSAFDYARADLTKNFEAYSK